MSFWRFMDYLTEEPTRCPFVEWYGVQDYAVQAELDVAVKQMAETDDWDEPEPRKRKYKILTNKHAGLCELRFRLDGRRFRPLGILNMEKREFTFLNGCEKGGMNIIPPDAFESALKLKAKFEEGRGTVREH